MIYIQNKVIIKSLYGKVRTVKMDVDNSHDIMRKRLKTYLIFNFTVLIMAIITVVFRNFIVSHNELYILSLFSKCPSSLLFHIYCPICGGTRAIAALMRLNISEAIKCNAFVVFLIVIFIYYDISSLVAIIRGKDKVLNISKQMKIAVLLVLSVFFIVRNIALVLGYDYLGDL